MNDAELVGDVLAGQTERFDALVSRYVGLARGLCASLVRDAAARDDVVQDSFVYAYTHLESLRDRRRFGPWLCTIVRNKSRDWLRSNKRREATERNLASQQGASPATPEDALIGEELRDWVRTQLSSLPERTREAMFLCYVEGMDQKEAAAFLGISIAALKKRLQYGRDRISERIWRDLENTDGPKRDHAKLAGAIVAAVHRAEAPAAAAGGIGGLVGLTMSNGKFVTVGAIVVALTVGAVVFPTLQQRADSNSTPTIPVPEAIEVASAEARVDTLQSPDAPVITPTRDTQTQEPIEDATPGIDGVVVLADSGEPVADVTVEVLHTSGRAADEPSTSVVTNDEGLFSFPDVDPESEFILQLGWPHRFQAEPFSRTWGRGPQPTHYIIKARAVGAITGYVRHPDGTPAYGARIIRDFPFGYRSELSAVTNEDGRFGFSHDGGTWQLRASGRLDNDGDRVVFDLVQGEIVEHDFMLPSGAAIHLRIVDKNGRPPRRISHLEVEGVHPELSVTGEPEDSWTGTDDTIFLVDDGVYTLPLLKVGHYTITIKDPQYVKTVAGPFVIDEKFEDQYGEVILERRPDAVEQAGLRLDARTVNLRVIAQDAEGNPLGTGGLFHYAMGLSGEVMVNPYALEPGNYWTAAVKEGYGADIRLQTASGENSEFAFAFGRGGTIHGVVPYRALPDGLIERIYVLPLEIWEFIGKPSNAGSAGGEYRQLGHALSQGAGVHNEDFTFAIDGLPAGWYVVFTNEYVSAPVEVRAEHTTGPVQFLTGPAESGR
jgi:RNA polymerase sigma-70 factor, ECF subfamily